MDIESIIESLQSVIYGIDKDTEIKDIENPISEELIFNNLSSSVLGLVTESSPDGCTGQEFGAGLHRAISIVAEQSEVPAEIIQERLLNYIDDIMYSLSVNIEFGE